MIKIVIKDLKLFFNDKGSMLMAFAVPIALITLFAFAYGGVGKGNKSNKIVLQVSDLDNTTESKEAIEQLDSLKSIQIKLKDLEDAENAIKTGEASSVLIIHKGFSDSLMAGNVLPLELKYDEAREIEIGLIQQSLIPTISMLPFRLKGSKNVIGKRLVKMTGTEDLQTQQSIQNQSDNLYDVIAKSIAESSQSNDKIKNPSSGFFGEDMKMTKIIKAEHSNRIGLVQAVAGTSVMMLLFSVVGIGLGLLDEKKEGTLKRLIYSPIKPGNILLGKMISANIMSILQLFIMFLFAWLAFGLKIGSQLPGMIITIIATSFACSAFGVFIASFAKKREQIQGLSILIILAMSAIGGSMMPLFFMPAFMQKLAAISVNYWSIQAFFDVFWRNLSVTDPVFLTRILILLLIGGILNTIAVVLFRKNILKLV